jgi:hypothetical protein
MKVTEFYEKYWTVDGKPVPPLDPREKAIWDVAEELEISPYVKVWRRKYGWTYIVHPIVQEHLDQQKHYE